MLPVLWMGFLVVILWAAVRARRSTAGVRIGRWAVGGLYLLAGALVNAVFVLRGDDYHDFASGAYVEFVDDTWESLVVPNHHVFISLLVLFEAAVGVLAILGGRWTQLAYVAAIAFHVALLSFGWGFSLWAVPMIWALVTLLRAERRTALSPQRVMATAA